MWDITPTYYAGGAAQRLYSIQGSGFELIPDNAIGILSENNDEPLMHLNSTSRYIVAELTKVDALRITANNGRHDFAKATYLGAIVSSDRTIVYWTNETKPLPQE